MLGREFRTSGVPENHPSGLALNRGCWQMAGGGRATLSRRQVALPIRPDRRKVMRKLRLRGSGRRPPAGTRPARVRLEAACVIRTASPRGSQVHPEPVPPYDSHGTGRFDAIGDRKSRLGMAAGHSSFGCAIARRGRLLACQHYTVVQTIEHEAHAEVNALRTVCQAVGDILLRGGRGVDLRALPHEHGRTPLGPRRDGPFRRDDGGGEPGRLQRAAATDRRVDALGRQPRETGSRLAGR